MTLYETISVLKDLALTQPNVRQAKDGSIYDIMNANPSCQYGSVVITQNTHRETDMFNYFGLTIFYVDRLVDNLEGNRLQIQSIGKEVLSNIIRTFCADFDVDCEDIVYTPFTEKFVDECAGVYCSISLEVPIDLVCAEYYESGVIPPTPTPIIIRNQSKSVTINENGTISVTYDEGYTGLDVVEITVDVPTLTRSGGEYLYEADYEDLDYEYAYDYFNDLKEVNVGGCSAIRKGNLVGRNLDWKDDYEVNIVVRYANTIGVAGGLSSLTVQQMDEGITEQQRKIIPFYLQDGFNDDLFAEMNVVPFNGCSKTVISDPTDSVCALMLVRYIIDHYTNIEDAIDGLSNTEIWLPQRLIEMGFGLHFMLADAERTVVLEIADNELKVVDSEISTNFEINGVTFRAGGGVWTPADAPTHTATSQGIADYGTGLERWNILNARNILNKDGMFAALDAVAFSKAYTTPWYDEFVGGDITVDTPITDPAFEARIAEYQARWEAHTKESADCWITCHSCVYDLANKVLYVRSQENGAENVYRNNYAEVWDYGYESGIAEQKEKLTDLTVSINGTYEREDGYNRVVVNVPQSGATLEDEKVANVTSTTQTVYPDAGYDGMKSVRVNSTAVYNLGQTWGINHQKSLLATSAFTANGTYRRTDGWKEITIDVPQQGSYQEGFEAGKDYQKSVDDNAITPTTAITVNGTYTADYGFKQVVVNVPTEGDYEEGYRDGLADGYRDGFEAGGDIQKSKLATTAFTQNGTYTRADGWKSVEVDVPSSRLEDKNVTVTANTQTVNPSTSYDGMSRVSIDATAFGNGKYADGQNAQKALLSSTAITQNGTYINENGFSSITVNVQTHFIDWEEPDANYTKIIYDVPSSRVGTSMQIIGYVNNDDRMRVDGGEWQAATENYTFTTAGRHLIEFDAGLQYGLEYFTFSSNFNAIEIIFSELYTQLPFNAIASNNKLRKLVFPYTFARFLNVCGEVDNTNLSQIVFNTSTPPTNFPCRCGQGIADWTMATNGALVVPNGSKSAYSGLLNNWVVIEK